MFQYLHYEDLLNDRPLTLILQSLLKFELLNSLNMDQMIPLYQDNTSRKELPQAHLEERLGACKKTCKFYKHCLTLHFVFQRHLVLICTKIECVS